MDFLSKVHTSPLGATWLAMRTNERGAGRRNLKNTEYLQAARLWDGNHRVTCSLNQGGRDHGGDPFASLGLKEITENLSTCPSRFCPQSSTDFFADREPDSPASLLWPQSKPSPEP